MDILKLFPSSKKKEDIEKEQRNKEHRDRHDECNKNLEEIIEKNRKREIEEKEKEKARIKIIQPLDIDKMEEYKNRTIQFLTQCKKKEYIYDFFQRMSSNVFFSKNIYPPFLFELGHIIFETIPKDEEQQLHILMNRLEYDDPLNREYLARTRSIVIIDTLYDFCKSVDIGIAEINENSQL